jgi:hypothetical protein
MQQIYCFIPRNFLSSQNQCTIQVTTIIVYVYRKIIKDKNMKNLHRDLNKLGSGFLKMR